MSQHLAGSIPAPKPTTRAALQDSSKVSYKLNFRQVLLSLELLPGSPWRGSWVGYAPRMGRGRQGPQLRGLARCGERGCGGNLSNFQQFCCRLCHVGCLRNGSWVRERRSSAVTMEELTVVARAPHVPTSLPAFSFPVTANLWSRAERSGRFVHRSRERLIHSCSSRSSKILRGFVLLGKSLARSIPVWLSTSPSCSSSRQGHAGCLAEVSAPG